MVLDESGLKNAAVRFKSFVYNRNPDLAKILQSCLVRTKYTIIACKSRPQVKPPKELQFATKNLNIHKITVSSSNLEEVILGPGSTVIFAAFFLPNLISTNLSGTSVTC
jgi:hypothetical protein